MLMISSILLLLVTLFSGFKIDESPYFIFTETLLNLLILGDFLIRVKLMGVKRFFEGGYWNIFDAVVVGGCVILYFLMLFSKAGALLIFEELSEELLLVSWSVF